jgi:hypothetical protein
MIETLSFFGGLGAAADGFCRNREKNRKKIRVFSGNGIALFGKN